MHCDFDMVSLKISIFKERFWIGVTVYAFDNVDNYERPLTGTYLLLFVFDCEF